MPALINKPINAMPTAMRADAIIRFSFIRFNILIYRCKGEKKN
jgi:hypothetical protein